jgi:hypothetical protein
MSEKFSMEDPARPPAISIKSQSNAWPAGQGVTTDGTGRGNPTHHNTLIFKDYLP